MIIESSLSTPESISRKTPVVTVIGVGGAGCNAVAHMAARAWSGVTFAVVHTQADVLARTGVARGLQIGARLTRGLSTGGDPAQGAAAAEQDEARLRELCQGADIVLLIVGLGGGTGSGAGPVVARLARSSGAVVLALATLPFEFEGTRRQEQARQGLELLQAAADGVICLPNQKVFKLLDENTPVLEAFRRTNDLLAEGVDGIWRLLTSGGLIPVDFADLSRVVRGRHAESALATAETKGPNRSREVLEKLMAHPLLDDGRLLADAADVLVSVVGGPDLTMAEINRVMDQIRRQCEQAHLILGAAIDPAFGDRLAVTVVASRRGVEAEVQEEPSTPTLPRGIETKPSAITPSADLEPQWLNPDVNPRTRARFVAPPPELTPAQTEQLFSQLGGSAVAKARARKLRQGQLPLEIVSKGRFERSEPTLYRGQDLDVPTYIRRGVALN